SKVRPCQADGFLFVADEEPDSPALPAGHFSLADLVSLRLIRVEVILAFELRAWSNMRADSQAEHDGALHSAPSHDRQTAGQREVHLIGLRVGRGTETRAAYREYLGFCGELDVRFQTDDDFPIHYSCPGVF